MSVKKFIKVNRLVSGVYRIFCLTNGKSYVGSSSKVGLRIAKHFCELRRHKHTLKKLQNDFCEFGFDSFGVELLEKCDNINLLNCEFKWFNIIDNKYNKNLAFNIINLNEINASLFWSRIQINNDINNCWEYITTCKENKYLRFTDNNQVYSAHRVAYFLSNPNSNQNIIIRHKCNNKRCCNPNHLEIGSLYDNSIDNLNSYNSSKIKLTWEIVDFIRERYALGISSKRIIKEIKNNFNITIMHINYIHKIVSNTIWIYPNYIPNFRNKRIILNKEIVNLVRQLEYTSFNDLQHKVLEKFNIKINIQTLQLIMSNKRWYDAQRN